MDFANLFGKPDLGFPEDGLQFSWIDEPGFEFEIPQPVLDERQCDSPAVLLVEEDSEVKENNNMALKGVTDVQRDPTLHKVYNGTPQIVSNSVDIPTKMSCCEGSCCNDLPASSGSVFESESLKDVETEKPLNSKSTTSQKIFYTINKLQKRQEQVDNGCFYKDGPGRSRKNPYMTSSQLLVLIKSYFRTRFNDVIKNEK